MAIVKNISDSNIIIEKQAVIPGDTIEIPNDAVQKYQKLIDNGMIKLEHNVVKRIEKHYELDSKKNEEYLKLKERLLPAFFSLYMNTPLSEQHIEDLKWFYKNVGPTSIVDIATKSLLDDVQDGEEFTETLLNHLYPELIKLHFSKFEN